MSREQKWSDWKKWYDEQREGLTINLGQLKSIKAASKEQPLPWPASWFEGVVSTLRDLLDIANEQRETLARLESEVKALKATVGRKRPRRLG